MIDQASLGVPGDNDSYERVTEFGYDVVIAMSKIFGIRNASMKGTPEDSLRSFQYLSVDSGQKQ